jgi:hypothetical protein
VVRLRPAARIDFTHRFKLFGYPGLLTGAGCSPPLYDVCGNRSESSLGGFDETGRTPLLKCACASRSSFYAGNSSYLPCFGLKSFGLTFGVA